MNSAVGIAYARLQRSQRYIVQIQNAQLRFQRLLVEALGWFLQRVGTDCACEVAELGQCTRVSLELAAADPRYS